MSGMFFATLGAAGRASRDGLVLALFLSAACHMWQRTANVDNSAPRSPVLPENIRDATPASVERCSFVAVLTATAHGFGDAGALNAKEDIREQAAERRATHLVWKQVTGGIRGTAEAEAFRCGEAAR